MAQIAVYKVVFHLELSSGRVTGGPYNTLVGISGGSRTDIHSQGSGSSVQTAITNNLLAILQGMGYAGATAPSGTVVVDSYAHAQSPDIFT